MAYRYPPQPGYMPGGAAGASNTAAEMSNNGWAPRIDQSAGPQSPWAPPQQPSFMQQQPQQPQPQQQGAWPSWLSPWGGAAGAPAPAAANAAPNMNIPGAAQTAAGGVPPWVMSLLYSGYAT